MGQALAGLFAGAGHSVVLSNSRGADAASEIAAALEGDVSGAATADAVRDADVVVLATPWGKTAEAVAAVADWSEKVVVDTTNNRTGPGPDAVIDVGDQASSEVVATLVPGARVVKAFNTEPIPVFAGALGPDAGSENVIYIAGDDANAKATVAELIASVGGEAVDTGSLASGGRLQGTDGPLAGQFRMLSATEARELFAEAAKKAA
jgi:hypothetical protein